MSDERPLLDTVLEMTADSVKRADLGDRDLMMVRLTALAAVNAPPGSYLLNLAAAADTNLTAEDIRGALIAVAPIIGTPKVVSAASAIATALGIAIELEDAIQSVNCRPDRLEIYADPLPSLCRMQALVGCCCGPRRSAGSRVSVAEMGRISTVRLDLAGTGGSVGFSRASSVTVGDSAVPRSSASLALRRPLR